MALSIADRVALAQTLWQSIAVGLADADEQSVIREAVRRDDQLSSGVVPGRSHDEVMQAARRAIGCG